jgi:hypothetical protein
MPLSIRGEGRRGGQRAHDKGDKSVELLEYEREMWSSDVVCS